MSGVSNEKRFNDNLKVAVGSWKLEVGRNKKFWYETFVYCAVY